MIVGYARTSTAEQVAGFEAQKRDLQAAGAERIFAEQVSSVAQRDALAECLRFVRQGDVLVVTKPDRLARSLAELLGMVADFEARGIGLRILSMGGLELDTRNATAKLILSIMGAVAAWEREIMLERQREGVARAQADGKYKGRAPTVQRRAAEIRALHAQGMGPSAIADQLGCHRASVHRVLAGGEADAA